MNILSFDTCFDACSVAAGRGLRTLTPAISFAFAPMQKGHAEYLLPMVQTIMEEVNLQFEALDRIAVTIGPGTFTGTRISVSAARALALATGAKVVAISSLRLMAMSSLIPAAPTRHIAVATDARRGDVYFEIFDRHSLQSIGGPVCAPVSDAAKMLGAAPIVIAGSGAESLGEAAKQSGIEAFAILPGLLPDAFDMLFMAAELPVSETPRPLYLRPPDATPPAPSRLVGAGA